VNQLGKREDSRRLAEAALAIYEQIGSPYAKTARDARAL
jgi:hypothetical protein